MKEYLSIKEAYLKQGVSPERAKKLAAMTFIKRHPDRAKAVREKYGKKEEYNEDINLIEQ